MRIVSLIASATEIVCALGRGGDLVARSHECDYPDFVRQLPAVTRPKFEVGTSSAEIDRQVKDLVRDGLSVYAVDAEQLEALRPDVIITQSQCEVCAVSLRDVERAVCSWMGRCPQVVSLEPNSLADVWADIERVALALDMYERGVELLASLRGRIEDIRRRSSPLPRPRVACVEWVQPLMAAGNWVPELVELANGDNLFGEAGKHSPWMEADALVASRPDVTILMPCGYDLERTLAEVPLVPAGLGGRVVAVDGNQYFNRPGPRVVESLEILAEVMRPGAFAFGHRGSGWREVPR